MSVMADQIMKRVRGKGRGWVFTPSHLIDLGTRGAALAFTSAIAA